MVRSLALLLKAQALRPSSGFVTAHSSQIFVASKLALPLFMLGCVRNAVFVLEITMPRINLSGMTVEGLMDLRRRVDDALNQRRAELEKQLERMAVVGGRRVVRGGASVLKGRKVPPKYRSPLGETWAGRGARPLWLVAAIKRGKKLDDFLIGKSAGKRRRKRRAKR